MRTGFMYLTAIIDVYSRRIVGWGISNSLAATWCKQVLEDAIVQYGKPEIINSDQGCQYTSAVWMQYLEEQQILAAMDGKGRALDNVWIERFWKSLKYYYVYLNPAEDSFELLEGFKTISATIMTKSIIPPVKHPMNDTIDLYKKPLDL